MGSLDFRGSFSKHGICCCNTAQTEAFIVIGATAVVTGLLWRSPILAPIKLVAVFLHEFSHALATWVTCGKVKAIEVSICQIETELGENIFLCFLEIYAATLAAKKILSGGLDSEPCMSQITRKKIRISINVYFLCVSGE